MEEIEEKAIEVIVDEQQIEEKVEIDETVESEEKEVTVKGIEESETEEKVEIEETVEIGEKEVTVKGIEESETKEKVETEERMIEEKNGIEEKDIVHEIEDEEAKDIEEGTEIKEKVQGTEIKEKGAEIKEKNTVVVVDSPEKAHWMKVSKEEKAGPGCHVGACQLPNQDAPTPVKFGLTSKAAAVPPMMPEKMCRARGVKSDPKPKDKPTAKGKSQPKGKAKSLPKAKAKSKAKAAPKTSPKAKASPKKKGKASPTKAKDPWQEVPETYQPGVLSGLRKSFLASLPPEETKENKDALWVNKRTELLDKWGMSLSERKKRRFE